MHSLFLIDNILAGLFSAPGRAVFWGALVGLLGMLVYVMLAPQEKIRNLKAQQKDNKANIKAYDGELGGLRALLKKDVVFSLKLVSVSLVPFVLSVVPAVVLFMGLETLYTGIHFPGPGMEWTDSFEFWYFLSVVVASLAIKVIFKIA